MMKEGFRSSDETNRVVGVSLSNDGETLAIGYVGGIIVYNLQDGMWKQIGDSIQDGFGGSMSLSSNGSRVATGSGAVYEYDKISDSWKILGTPIPSPFTVSLSGSGNRLAAGYNLAIVYDYNMVKVYDYNMDSDSWEQVGDMINGFEKCCGPRGKAGAGITLSEDGTTFVFPASDSNLVQPYRFKEGKGVWERLGQALKVNRADSGADSFRASITNNGDRLVIGDVLISNAWNEVYEGESYVSVYDLRRGI